MTELLEPFEAATGISEGFFGQHLTGAELDAEFLSRLEPRKLKDMAAFNSMAWYGYRFMHPGHRVFLFIHNYAKAHKRTSKMLGNRWASPKYLRGNPLTDAPKAVVTGFITATFNADAHGIPYDLWCEATMEQSLRVVRARPLLPHQMYQDRMICHVLDKWQERNDAGIYLAQAPQYRNENYAGHPWQDAYQNHLADLVAKKPNRPFWVGRLVHVVGHMRPQTALARFGADVLEESERYK